MPDVERSHDGNSLASDWRRIQPTADGKQLIPFGGGNPLPGPCSGIKIAGDGGIIIVVSRSSAEMPWDSAKDGRLAICRAVGVKEAGTTATEIYAMY